MNKYNTTWRCVGYLFFLLFFVLPAQAELRKVKIGDSLPQFTVSDIDNKEYSYKHENSRAIAIAFLSATQTQSLHALDDIQKVVENLRKQTDKFDFLIILNESETESPIQVLQKNPKPGIHILMDSNYKLWGLLGAIAKPTTVVVAPDSKVLWTQAGYSYDYQPALRLHLAIATGIEDIEKLNNKVQVQTLENNSVSSKIDRHIHMSRMLEQKGRLESAAAELQHALNLDPNSVLLTLELAELNCRTGRPQVALDIIADLQAQTTAEKSRVLFIQGWANVQLGRLDLAEKSFLVAVDLEPKSARAFYELGRIYHKKGDTEKALEFYRKALELIFPAPPKP